MYTFHDDGSLPKNGEIFVFGSNLAGIHGAGAAKVAIDKFGAVWGQGQGLNGQSYAIATKDENFWTRPLDDISFSITIFCHYTQISSNADKRWFVTRVGCGLAGLKDEVIAPMFKNAINCSFAKQWEQYLV